MFIIISLHSQSDRERPNSSSIESSATYDYYVWKRGNNEITLSACHKSSSRWLANHDTLLVDVDPHTIVVELLRMRDMDSHLGIGRLNDRLAFHPSQTHTLRPRTMSVYCLKRSMLIVHIPSCLNLIVRIDCSRGDLTVVFWLRHVLGQRICQGCLNFLVQSSLGTTAR